MSRQCILHRVHGSEGFLPGSASHFYLFIGKLKARKVTNYIPVLYIISVEFVPNPFYEGIVWQVAKASPGFY